ncbi:MAG: TonB-dependent receptor [Deltaproteobacteria bacterium]|nr:TonB-dependent receptor [Deltaproteobacteria bacterium]
MRTSTTLYAMIFALVFSASNAFADEKQNNKTGENAEQEALPQIVPPVLISEPELVYPKDALEKGITAQVVMEIDIDAEGQVEGVTVVEGAKEEGYGFDEAAVNAANLFEFKPATENGVPIPVRITYRYNFAISIADDSETEPDTDSESSSSKEIIPDSENKKKDLVVNLKGSLKERGTRLPLVGVTVTVFRGEGNLAVGYESITDQEGKFEFYNLAKGEWKILGEAEGYFPLRTSETVEDGKLTTVNYFLERSEYNSYDVLVEGEQIKKEVSRTTLDIVEVERVPGTFGDVLNVVQNLPGVARTSPLGGNLVVRGSSSEDTQIFVDGVSVPIVYHFGGLRSVIPLGMLGSLDFYPGNFTPEFGRATGGVIDVRLKELKPEKFGGYVDVNIIDSGIYLETPVGKKAAFAAAFRRSYIDGIINAVVPASGNLNLVTAPRYYDYQLLTNFRPDSNHQFKAFFFGSDDELKLLFENPSDVSADLVSTSGSTSTSFYRTVLEHDYTPSAKFSNIFKTSAGRNMIYIGVGDQVFLDLNTYVAQIYDKAKISLNDNLAIVTGIDYLYSKADARIKFPAVPKEGEPGAKPDLDTVQFIESKGEVNHSVGGFVQLETRFFDRLTLVPGIRFDYFTRVDRAVLAPRFNARYSLTDQWAIKGGVGVYYQEPSFDETSPIFGNPDLGPEKAIHYSLGFEYQPLEYLTLDVVGFYKDMEDLVSRTQNVVERDGEMVPLNFSNGGLGRVFGMEVLLKHNFANNFTGWLSYTLSKALRKDAGQTAWREFDYDQTHILTILGTYNLPRNWSVGFRWRLVTGSPTTLRSGAIYSVDDAQYESVFEKTNSSRFPVFHQGDIRVDKKWIFDNWMFTAYLDVQNIYNSTNVTGYSYNYDSTEKRPSQGLPILPVIGIKGEF